MVRSENQSLSARRNDGPPVLVERSVGKSADHQAVHIDHAGAREGVGRCRSVPTDKKTTRHHGGGVSPGAVLPASAGLVHVRAPELAPADGDNASVKCILGELAIHRARP